MSALAVACPGQQKAQVEVDSTPRDMINNGAWAYSLGCHRVTAIIVIE